MQVNQLIRQQFPGTEVVGSNYPPPATNVALSKLVSFGTMGAVATTFFGEKMFEMLGMPRPEFVQSMQSNKMGSCMGAWFLGNMVSQNLLNTGAFEVRTETDRNRSSRGPLYPPSSTLVSSSSLETHAWLHPCIAPWCCCWLFFFSFLLLLHRSAEKT